MSKTVIKLENVSKLYQLGQIGTGTLRHDLHRWWAKMLGKDDPYAKIGQANIRTEKSEGNEFVWALKDINLEVEQGETLGIIGKNGAGKSTLLKILSRVTSPTTGQIKVKGRIASLLEVGTGFHPELTGRENIFLNGAILGMTKAEIRKKLDEIIDFSGVEKYIDTPVKRYSSGMYVRLAFAVAAHLESEILIVDEVLAVGDAEFQKKCLGKMQDVSHNEGRTVLFVSHNMGAIQNLCRKSLLLNFGKLEEIGMTESIIQKYIMIQNISNISKAEYSYVNRINNLYDNRIYIRELRIYNHNKVLSNNLVMGKKAFFEISVDYLAEFPVSEVGILFKNRFGQRIASFTSALKTIYMDKERKKHEIATFILEKVIFSKGDVYFDLIVYVPTFGRIDNIENAGVIHIIEDDVFGNGVMYTEYLGFVYLDGYFEIMNR